MSKYFNFKRVALFSTIVLFMSSCSSDDKKNDDTASTNSAAAKSTSTSSTTSPSTLLSGTLDTLWVAATKFKTLSTARLVLSFQIVGPDTLTLYGWSCKNSGGNCTGEFSHDPDLKLEKGGAVDVGYGPIVFWDNLILEKKDVKGIQDKIGTNILKVLFLPQNKNGHIIYRIVLTGNDLKDNTKFYSEDTGIDANPSPPKNNTN